MKRIITKSLYSLGISYVIFNLLTLANGYFKPLQTLILILLFHIAVLLIGLLELLAEKRPAFSTIPHWTLIGLFGMFTLPMVGNHSTGNDFYMAPLSIVIAQSIVLIVIKTRRTKK